MAGVYNRKLFRQSSARDQLRKLGGIMSSSEELMREAMRTAMQAPEPSDLGPMPMPQQPALGMPAQPVMPQQPMMQQPMMQPQQPMMQPQQPMDMGMGVSPQPMMQQQPIQPAIAEPAFMPPTMPQSAQMQPMQLQGFQEGGQVIVGAGTKFPRMVDVTQPAGTAVETPSVNLDEDIVATAKDLEMRLEDEPPYAVANKILAKAEEKGAELTGDVQTDLAGIYANLTGDPEAYEKNIDALNRGIIGAAIASGTSARATENIAKGMLVGLEAAKDTEERRVRDARALQLAELQARGRAAGGDSESRAYRNPVDAYQDAYQAVMNAGEFDIEIPEGLTREEYADQVATDLITRSYTPDQLVGSPFEGLSTPAAGGEGSTQTEADVLQSARAALQAGAPEAAVKERLAAMGIDPEKL